MKFKKVLLLLAPAMLLASCNTNAKTTTTISKINLSNTKTLVMGKLNNLASIAHEEEEQLISVSENGEATETKVEVTTGDTKTETTNITISRLVKLNKEYAVVSCTYNNVTYDLIVNLSTGNCIKFPDSSLLPNTKEKLGGHRAYRKYQKQYGYLNKNVVQPNEEVNIFYYVNHYQCDASNENVYARRIAVLDLTGDAPSVRAIVTPKDKHSVQTFAVDNNGNIIYISSISEKITGKDPTSQFDAARLHYDDDKEDIEVSFDTNKYSYIAPTLITGNDGLIYCYLKLNDNKQNFVMANINISLDGEIPVANATPVESSDQTLVTYPEKIFTVKGTDDKGVKSINTVSVTKTNKINQLFSFVKKEHNSSDANSKSSGLNKPKPTPTPSPYKKKEKDKPTSVEVKSGKQGEEVLTSIEDGFSGNNYSYLFGTVGKNPNRRFLKKIKYENGEYKYIGSILDNYFANLTADIVEAETDESTEDVTVVVDNGNDTETAVVVDENTSKEIKLNISDISDVVDVNN